MLSLTRQTIKLYLQKISCPSYTLPIAEAPQITVCKYSGTSESKSLILEAPSSEQAPTLTSNLRVMTAATVDEDSMSRREAVLHGSMTARNQLASDVITKEI